MPTIRKQVPRLKPRLESSHKGDFGRAVLIGGARGMAGAISIASLAALRSGAGWVSAAIPDRILETVAAIHPCLMTIPLPNDDRGRISYEAIGDISHLTEQATCMAIGPGMGRSADINRLLRLVHEEARCPIVVDADGLFALSTFKSEKAVLEQLNPHRHARVWTPHAGEFERLSGVPAKDRSTQIDAAHEIARAQSVVIVLKGNRTIVTDGEEYYENKTGNAKMATGGCGDCLTGIITALICQSMPIFDASILGVYIHGLAGDYAAETAGNPSVLATDIIDQLTNAFER